MKKMTSVMAMAAIGCYLPPSGWAGEIEVGIAEYRFEPARLKVSAGDTVRWVNREKRTSHSVLFLREGSESDRLMPGDSWARTFPNPGLYPYSCGPHPEMKGMIEVIP